MDNRARVILFGGEKECGENRVILPDQKQVMVYNFAVTVEFKEYTLEDIVPVAIWDNKCELIFAEIYEKIRFLYC